MKRVPQTLDAGTARTSRRRLRHPTVPPPMPGNRRAADRLLTLSTPVEFPIQTAPALLLFHGAVFFSVSRTTRSRGSPFPRPPAGVPAVCSWQAAGSFFVWNAETARLQLTTVRLCGTITDGNRIWQGKSLGKRRLSPAEGAKLSGGPIRAGTKDGCGSGEAHCEDRRCKAATPNLSGKRTE